MNSAGLETGWRVIHGQPDFYSITKKMHNALQGDQINLSELKMEIYENVADAERFEAELGALAERHGLAALLAPGSARKREVFLGF